VDASALSLARDGAAARARVKRRDAAAVPDELVAEDLAGELEAREVLAAQPVRPAPPLRPPCRL
jgi:hypothetical protein